VNLRDEQFYLKALAACTILIGLIWFVASAFRNPTSTLSTQNASRTRTAIALTEQVLYGPFPTATGPTPTVTNTPRDTVTPTPTASRTPTPTRFRYFIDTAAPRRPRPNAGSTPVPPTAALIQPTNPPPTHAPPTNLPPTNPPPTDPPINPTPCLNPQGHPIPCK
jgi:hypothetical protein